MCDCTQETLAAQSEIGVALRDGEYPSIKTLARRAKMHPNTFSGYFPADRNHKPVQLPLGAFNTLLKRNVLPADLLDLLLTDDWHAVRAPDGLDHDEIARIAAELLAIKNAAHHPDSPAGVMISDCEAERIACKVAEMRAVA